MRPRTCAASHGAGRGRGKGHYEDQFFLAFRIDTLLVGFTRLPHGEDHFGEIIGHRFVLCS